MLRIIFGGLVIVLLMASVSQAQVELAKSGQAKAVIVLSDSAQSCKRSCRSELSPYSCCDNRPDRYNCGILDRFLQAHS